MTYEDFKEKIITTGLTEKRFSELTHTPLPTIKGWSAKRTNKTPKWVDYTSTGSIYSSGDTDVFDLSGEMDLPSIDILQGIPDVSNIADIDLGGVADISEVIDEDVAGSVAEVVLEIST